MKDTEEAAVRAQLDAVRRLGREGRVRIAAEMSEDLRKISIAGVMRRHPGMSRAGAVYAVFRGLWGESLASSAWPDAPPHE